MFFLLDFDSYFTIIPQILTVTWSITNEHFVPESKMLNFHSDQNFVLFKHVRKCVLFLQKVQKWLMFVWSDHDGKKVLIRREWIDWNKSLIMFFLFQSLRHIVYKKFQLIRFIFDILMKSLFLYETCKYCCIILKFKHIFQTRSNSFQKFEVSYTK